MLSVVAGVVLSNFILLHLHDDSIEQTYRSIVLLYVLGCMKN